MNDIAARLLLLEERIEAACRKSGRKRSEIQLMAVTKFHPLESVEAAYDAGIRLFGENRVKEAKEKFAGFWEKRKRDGNVQLHLIGSLQRNKAQAAAAFFDCIQSVDRDSLIDELGILTREREYPLMVMLEYHTGEESKAGFPGLDDLFRAAEKTLSFPGLRPVGLMTMAPFTDDEAAIRGSFRKLADARSELEKRFPNGTGSDGYWSCLSMGMTGDFEIAIEEGSTLIRIGTAIFGERVT
ncbi:MAG: YggS family pyridoxal phosphate-dependent enzyme [Treponema sp.]|jgi:pyridoxal phosphate enzyme (YggS family)|nr:YggS family pyridoxal phosphate-dependent enzyme [Treponema sp.]